VTFSNVIDTALSAFMELVDLKYENGWIQVGSPLIYLRYKMDCHIIL